MDIDALVALAEGLDTEEFRRLVRARLRNLPAMSSGPRDVRRGDRWLPWHFPKPEQPPHRPAAGSGTEAG